MFFLIKCFCTIITYYELIKNSFSLPYTNFNSKNRPTNQHGRRPQLRKLPVSNLNSNWWHNEIKLITTQSNKETQSNKTGNYINNDNIQIERSTITRADKQTRAVPKITAFFKVLEKPVHIPYGTCTLDNNIVGTI